MTEMGRELQVSWSQLHSWQDQALEGMLRALEPKRKGTDRPPPLTAKLRKLLAKKGLTEQATAVVTPSLQRRLSEIQDTKKQTS
jgi:hypothetical protein